MATLDHLEKLLAEGKISRRQFLSRAAALGLTAAVSPALLSKPARAAVSKKGGHFVQALTGGSTTDSLDPATHTANWNMNVERQLRNSLVEIDHNFRPIPELAESWESSPDAKKWIFELRKGVEFSNGKGLDAQDVIDSINYHRGADSKSAAKPYLEPVANIMADGKHTVIFELSVGVADFPFIMSDYHLTIFPAGTTGAEFEKGIGTGPYLLENWEPGVTAITKRNPNYWKEGRGHFDSVETLSINDVNARTNALKTGQIHFMDRCERKTVHLFKQVPGIEIIAVTGALFYTMPMHCKMKPYDDNNVRLGLKYAVDRDDMVKRILSGYGETGNDHPIPSVFRYFAKDLPKRTYDPEKANFYMKKAGMLDHTFNLHTSEAAFQGADDAAVLYQQQAKKAGIKVNVVKEPSDGYWDNVWTKKEFCMCYWTATTEDMIFTVGYAANAPWNDAHWYNERFNKLLVEAKAELDDQKRASMYAEMQQICKDEGGTIVPISPHSEADGERNTERWWFK
jgi:peptide/nickel transport system substrate-binding protein